MTKEEIKNIRLKYELTQQELSCTIGTTRQQINYWEKGKAKPNIKHRKILRYFTNFEFGKDEYFVKFYPMGRTFQTNTRIICLNEDYREDKTQSFKILANTIKKLLVKEEKD